MERKAALCAPVLEVLDKGNYVDWSIRVKTYLMAQDLWDTLEESTTERPKEEDDKATFRTWSKKNFMALHVIQSSCGPDTFYDIRKISSAKIAWNTLATKYEMPKNTISVVSDVLDEDNYMDWSAQVKTYLMAQDLWDTVEATTGPPEEEDDEAAFKAWNKKNSIALHVIQNSCGPDTFSKIRETSSAKTAWDTLAGKDKVPKNTDSVVRDVLGEDNYMDWSARVKTYLMAQDLWDTVEATTRPPKEEDDEVAFKAWSLKNSIALQVIHNSCGPDIFSEIREISSAKTAWDTLDEKYTVYAVAESGTDMYKAVRSGDWSAVQELLRSVSVSATITPKGETALHIAVAFGHVHIVEELVKLMSEKQLEIQDDDSYTALMSAVMRGKYEVVECMLTKNKKLISIGTGEGRIPIVMAIYYGQTEMARNLYPHTPREDLMPEKDSNGAKLCVHAISHGIFDIALDLIKKCPRLALADEGQSSPLSQLASKPHAFPSGNRFVFGNDGSTTVSIHIRSTPTINEVRVDIQKEEKGENDQVTTIGSVPDLVRHLVSNVLNFLGIGQLYEIKLIHEQSRELLHCMCERIPSLSDQEKLNGRVYDAMFSAVKNGIFEIVFELLKADIENQWSIDGNARNIFALAVLHRQAEIFSIIFGLDLKNTLISFNDDRGNTMLHMAGMSADSTILNRIPGAALQMQRELQWFKEVEIIVPPGTTEATNHDGRTAQELFTENHKDLMEKGEKWMKDTSTSCTVVGALVITIMFAAAFTVPGGNDQNTGFPIFINEKLFMLFIISDALSLFSSATSVLMFLGILTSRYAEDDFLESLPRKMIIGLSTLFFSIAAMMISFSAALLIMLREHTWIIIPVICLASIPITLFVLMQFPPLIEMSISTYGRGIFNRKMKLNFK